MWKYQYDDEYVMALDGKVFLKFDNYEEEEAFALNLKHGQ